LKFENTKHPGACHVAHAQGKIEAFSSNELYRVHLSTFITHFMITLPISSGQGVAIVFWHPVL